MKRGLKMFATVFAGFSGVVLVGLLSGFLLAHGSLAFGFGRHISGLIGITGGLIAACAAAGVVVDMALKRV